MTQYDLQRNQQKIQCNRTSHFFLEKHLFFPTSQMWDCMIFFVLGLSDHNQLAHIPKKPIYILLVGQNKQLKFIIVTIRVIRLLDMFHCFLAAYRPLRQHFGKYTY